MTASSIPVNDTLIGTIDKAVIAWSRLMRTPLEDQPDSTDFNKARAAVRSTLDRLVAVQVMRQPGMAPAQIAEQLEQLKSDVHTVYCRRRPTRKATFEKLVEKGNLYEDPVSAFPLPPPSN